MRSRRAFAGLTLLELIAGLAIAGIVLALGVPAFGGWFAEQQVQDRADALVTHSISREARPSGAATASTSALLPPLAMPARCRGKAAGRSWPMRREAARPRSPASGRRLRASRSAAIVRSPITSRIRLPVTPGV